VRNGASHLNKIREKTALLDKVEIGGISILNFKNFEELLSKNVVEVSTSNVKHRTATGQEFTRLNIDSDGVIDKMIAGAKIMGNKKIDYCNMSTSIKNTEIGNLACYTVSDYVEHFMAIQEHLTSRYGIEVDMSDMALKGIEINRTFKLENDFETYHRVLQLIMANLPSYMRNQMDYRKVNNGSSEYQTYYATSKTTNKSKRYLLFKIYNKTKAIENIILLTDSFMRVELKLVGAEKIKKALGTNRFAELTDKIINDYFDNQIQKMIVQPYQRWKKERDKYLVGLMEEQHANSCHWITNTLRILQDIEIRQKKPILLDIEELIPLIDEVIKSKKRNDVKRTFRHQAQQYEKAFCNNDNLKILEIITKLTAKEEPTLSQDTDRDAPPNVGNQKSA
jgi:hypothetical protein